MLGIFGDFAMSNGIFCLSRSIFPSMSKQHSLGRVGGKKEGLGREEVKSEEKKKNCHSERVSFSIFDTDQKFY